MAIIAKAWKIKREGIKKMNIKRRLRRSVKAISPVISVLLMIAVAVAASLVAYAWVMGYLSFTTSKVGKAIQIQSIVRDPDTGIVTVYVQNVGDSAVKLANVYADGDLNAGATSDPAFGSELAEAATATITLDGDYSAAERLTVKVVAEDGTFIEMTRYDLTSGGSTTPTIRYRKMITFNGGASGVVGTHTDFPVLISISDDTDISGRSDDGHEIYFTATDGSTKLDHELEAYSEDGSGADMIAWVRIPSPGLSAGTSIYIYYGETSLGPQENPTGVWDSNYKGVWHLKEAGSGAIGEYKDSTANNNHGRGGGGTPDRVPALIAGKIGNAQDFEGDTTSDFIDVGSSTSLQITGSITLESWIWIESYEPEYYHMIICRQYGTSTGDGYLLFTDDTFKAYIAVNAASGSVSTSAPATGSWHHIVGVASASTMRIYIDGNELATTTGKTWTLDANEVTIGAGYNGGTYPNEPFDGKIDEVRISNNVRSLEWIQTEYNNQNNPSAFHGSPGPEQAV